MKHIINIAFDFEDEQIAKTIEEQVCEEVINNITKEVENLIYTRRNWSAYGSEKDSAPLQIMVDTQIHKILDDNKELIIETAAQKLADSLKRTKAVKEAVGKVLDNNKVLLP